MKDLTYIKVKEGKLWASDMVKPDKENCKGTRIKAMEAFNQSFVEGGGFADPETENFILERIPLNKTEYDYKDGLYPVSGLQFEVRETCGLDGTTKCSIVKNCVCIHDELPRVKVAILSLKQEQPSEEKGMDVLKIYRFQAKQIEDTFRLVQRVFECDKKESSVDRDVMQSWQMIKNVLEGKIDKHVPRT